MSIVSKINATLLLFTHSPVDCCCIKLIPRDVCTINVVCWEVVSVSRLVSLELLCDFNDFPDEAVIWESFPEKRSSSRNVLLLLLSMLVNWHEDHPPQNGCLEINGNEYNLQTEECDRISGQK